MNKKLVAIGCFFCLITPCANGVEPLGTESARSQSVALTDPAWLAKQLGQPDVRLLEIGQRESYDLGHIPQAAFVDWIVDITDPRSPERYNVLTREQLEVLLSRLGVSKDTTVVLYDKLENRLATRMFWTLRFYGHQRIKIFDGGEKAWLKAGQQLSVKTPVFETTDYRVKRVNSAFEADQEFIKAHLAQPQFALIDGRQADQFTGKLPGKVYHTGKEHARRGHLPQAINVPWKENLTADGRFKSVSELRKLYGKRGVAKDGTIVTYCNEGLHAAHPWFVLTELLGHCNVRLYDDSLSEWANTPDEPLIVQKR